MSADVTDLEDVRRIAKGVAAEMGLPAEVEVQVFRATGSQAKEAQKAASFNAEAKALIAAGAIVEPPYPLGHLSMRPMFSSILPQCIDSRATHIVGWGFGFAPKFDPKAAAKGDTGFVENVATPERVKLRRTIEGLGGAEGFEVLLDKIQRDIDTVGHSGVEVIRDLAGKELVDLKHVAGRTILLGYADDEPTLVNRPRLSEDGSSWEACWRWEHLRPMVQVDGARKVWFKQHGDPRAISRVTGRPLKSADGTPVEHDPANPTHAREMLLFRGPYNANSPYSLPPWAGTIPSLRKSEMIEDIGEAFLNSGGVPPVIITLYGASVSPESTKRFKEEVEAKRGPDSRYKVLVMNAIPDAGSARGNMDASSSMTPKIGVTQLGTAVGDEAFYDAPDATARAKVRSACGLAPIHVGESSDYNRATAQSTMEWAEASTFGPARKRIERTFNRAVLPELGAIHWAMRIQSPDLTNPEDVERVVGVGLRANVGTSNDYAPLIEKVLGIDISTVDELWGNLPPQMVQTLLASGSMRLDTDGDGDVDVSADGEVERMMRSVSPRDRVRLAAGIARLRDALVEAA